MKRKYAQTLVAVVILGALWGWFDFYSKRKAKETTGSETKQEKILTLGPDSIQSFTLKPRDGESLTCNREGGEWAIVEPMKLPADQDAVSSFLRSVTDATVDEVVDPHPANVKPFGLDDPAETITVVSKTKPENHVLLIGDETPTSGGVYAQVGGNPRVVKLASYLKASLEKNLFDLRDKRAVSLNADQVKRIEVISKKASYTLEKNPEGVWDLVLPPPVRADHFTVDGLVNQLRDLSMRSVVAEDKRHGGDYGFAAPALTVRLQGPAASQTLVLGREDLKQSGRYYAANSDLTPIFTLESSFLPQLEKQPADLRDKDLFSFSQFDAKRIDVSTPAGHRVFELQKDKWKQTTPAAKDVPRDKIDDLLGSLRDLRAQSFPEGVSVTAAGLAKPAYRFVVEFGDKNQKETVEVSKAGDHVYARRSDDPLPSEISKDALGSIEKALGKL